MNRIVGVLLLFAASLVAGARIASAQDAAANPIYDIDGNNVVPGRWYQLSAATNDYFVGYGRDTSGMCRANWLTVSGSQVQYARFCSDVDCKTTNNRDSMIIQLNCGYIRVEGSTVRMTLDKNEATWFDSLPRDSQTGKGYALHARATSKYLALHSPGEPITVQTDTTNGWFGLKPISGNPTSCTHVDTGCLTIQPDRMLNKPVYTNVWKNAYLPTKCNFGWKASPLYHKSMLFGFMAFKQDNNWDNGRLATQLVDIGRFSNADLSPAEVVDNRKMKWFSDRKCLKSSGGPCTIPGLCGPGGGSSWAGIVVVIFEWLNKSSNEGRYCAGLPKEDAAVDCCARAPNEELPISPVYYFEQGGEVSVDNKASWFPMYYVYGYRQSAKVYMRNECNGDDIYWGNQDPSFIYFTNHSVRQGQVWIRYWGRNADGSRSVEEAQDTYVTPPTPEKPETPPKADANAFVIPFMPDAPAPAGNVQPIWRRE